MFVSVDGGAYSPWLTNTIQTQATFQGQMGHTYAFYSLATDSAGNTQAVPSTPDAQTTVLASQ